MVAHVCNLSTGKMRHEDYHESEASLGYTARLRCRNKGRTHTLLPRVMEREPTWMENGSSTTR